MCIAGPTASGKTGFAVRLAERVNGEIINADALQVYSDLHILSARPSDTETAQIPHHLFGHVSGDTRYSVGHWLREAVPVILDCLVRGKVPIVVGGTGLYFKALTVGLADVPDVPDRVMADLCNLSVSELRDRALSLDPVAAGRVLGDDPQRLARIVGVAQATGRKLSDWQAATRPVIPPRYHIGMVLLPDRDELYQRIDERFERMVDTGALSEARAVMSKGYDTRSPMLKAIGLSHLLAHLRGEASLGGAIETAKRDTRRLAKRQSTWFRNQTEDWPKLTSTTEMETFLEEVVTAES